MADTGGLTITEENPTSEKEKDDDDLTHLICRGCEAKAKAEGKPIPALCGKEQDTWTSRSWPGGAEGCVVCFDMLRRPCKRCGRSNGGVFSP